MSLRSLVMQRLAQLHLSAGVARQRGSAAAAAQAQAVAAQVVAAQVVAAQVMAAQVMAAARVIAAAQVIATAQAMATARAMAAQAVAAEAVAGAMVPAKAILASSILSVAAPDAPGPQDQPNPQFPPGFQALPELRGLFLIHRPPRKGRARLGSGRAAANPSVGCGVACLVCKSSQVHQLSDKDCGHICALGGDLLLAARNYGRSSLPSRWCRCSSSLVL